MPILIPILLLTFATLASPAQTPEETPSEDATARQSLQDAALKTTIEKRFADSAIAVNHFEVEVRDGAAILRGRTDVVQHKGVATRLARLAGAENVDNRIEVTDRARAKASRSARSTPRRVHVQRSRGEPRDQK